MERAPRLRSGGYIIDFWGAGVDVADRMGTPRGPCRAMPRAPKLSGKTNRGIGEELFISEKTVACHVSNIFDTRGVSTRSAATAWACQRDLV